MKIKNIKFLIVSLIIICMTLCISTIEAITINTKNKINIGEIINVTLDFGTYIAAYDSLEIKFNNRIIKYNSTYPLIEGLWWDTTEESTGINKKVYSFIGIGNGTSTINVKIKGLVSANSQMTPLGDIELTKTITVGNGAKKGDLDGNGIVNANDAAIALDLYKYGNITNDDLIAGDMDSNGIINANDAALILDIYKYGN